MNQTLIARLRSGEIAAENNGTVEQLREVLKAAFPEDIDVEPEWKYYMKNPFTSGEWVANSKTILPTVPITDFFTSSIEDRAIELLRELVRTTPRAFMAASDGKEDWCKRLAEKKAAFTNAEQFLNELNKEK